VCARSSSSLRALRSSSQQQEAAAAYRCGVWCGLSLAIGARLGSIAFCVGVLMAQWAMLGWLVFCLLVGTASGVQEASCAGELPVAQQIDAAEKDFPSPTKALDRVQGPVSSHQCEITRDDVEAGVLFVNDSAAAGLFLGNAAWERAKGTITAMASLPGAGNTWTRLLVEKGAGLRTGSVFADGGLKRMGMDGEGSRDSSVIMVKTHYPALGDNVAGAERIVWLVRHPLRNIIAAAKWFITGTHTKLVTQAMLDDYLTKARFNYHLTAWIEHASKWAERADKQSDRVLVVRYEELQQSCETKLGQVIDWLELKQRPGRIACACQKDERVKRPAPFKPFFAPELLLIVMKKAGGLMAKLGYDIDQNKLGTGSYGLPPYDLPDNMLTNYQ
jgi:hypothetical protein